MNLLEAMYAALREPIGYEVIITEGTFEQARLKAYAQRKAACDPQLDQLQFNQSPTDPNVLWIVKKGPSL